MGETFKETTQIGRADRAGKIGWGVIVSVDQVLDERAIPELNGGLDPGRLVSEARKAFVVKGSVVDQDRSARGTVPSKKYSCEARLPAPRVTDDGNVASRLDSQMDIVEDGVSGRNDSNAFQNDGDSGISVPDLRSIDFGLLRRYLVGLHSNRFKKTEGQILHRRILPRQESDRLTECWKLEPPPGKEKDASVDTDTRDMIEEKPCGEAEPGQRLQALHQGRAALQSEARSCPFDQQTLVFAPDIPFGAMRSYRGQPEQSIEVESTERADVRPRLQVALGEDRIEEKGNCQNHPASDEHKKGSCRIEPDNTGDGKNELEDRSEQLASETGEGAYSLDAVTPLRHVADRTALKVSIAKKGDFLHEGQTESDLQPSSHPEKTLADRQIDHKEDRRDRDERADGDQPLFRKREPESQIEETPEEKGFKNDTGGGNREGGKENKRGQEPILAENLEDASGRMAWRFIESADKIRGQLRCGSFRLFRQTNAVNANQNGSPELNLFIPFVIDRRRPCRPVIGRDQRR